MNDGTSERPPTSPSRLFAVRLWTEEVAGGSEYRGSVRAVASGAHRGFRDWSDLVTFMIGQLTDDEHAQMGDTEGALGWPVEQQR